MTNPRLSNAVTVDRRTGLVALRDTLAAELEDSNRPPHTTAPLARQLQNILREIDELPDPTEPRSRIDQLMRSAAERRVKREPVRRV